MVCGRRFFMDHHVCKREPHEYGLHRNHPVLRFATVVWGDGDCAPEEQPEKADATEDDREDEMRVGPLSDLEEEGQDG